MAQRGRPRKKVRVEEPKVEVEEATIEEVTIEEPKVETINVESDALKSDDIYDLNSSGESKLGGSYNPFGESVEEKAYRTPKIATAESIPVIDEPAFVAPTYDDLVTANENIEQNGEDGKPVQEEKTGLDRFSQEEVKEMSPKDKTDSAEGLTTVALSLYSMGCKGLGSISKISDKKLKNLEAEGLIDTTMRVPVDRHTTASVRQIVDSINDQATEAFEVSDEFKEKVAPVMTRVFEKRGWGVTDEQNLMIMFGTDIAQKIAIVAQMRSAANYQLDAFMKMYEIQNGGKNVEFVQPTIVPQSDTAPQASQVVEEDKPEEKVEEGSQRRRRRKDDTESSMVASENPDLKVSQSDLAQVDVDNV